MIKPETWGYGQAVKVKDVGTFLAGQVGMVYEDKGEDEKGDMGVLVLFLHPIGHATRPDPVPSILWHEELELVDDWDLYDKFVDEMDEETVRTVLKAEARSRAYWLNKYNEQEETHAG